MAKTVEETFFSFSQETTERTETPFYENVRLMEFRKDKNGCPDLRLTYSIIVDYGKKKTVYVLCCFHNGRKEHEYKKEKLFGVA